MSNVVTLSIVFLLVLLIALFWYQAAGISTEESMAASALTVFAVTFLSGAAGNASYVYPAAAFIGAAGMLLFLLNKGRRRSKEQFWKRAVSFVSPSLVVVAAIFVYCVIFFRRSLFTYPDEVYQWGASVKYMVETGLLPFGENFTGDSVTFSICTMFQYFFSGIGSFVESNAFVGNFILTFIPVMLPCRKSGWKHWKSVFMYAAVVFLSLNLISYVKYYTVLQDYVLPMWAGGILAWLLWRGKEKINWIFLFFSLSAIAAMKSLVGPLFACVIILTAFLSEYFRDCNDDIFGWKKLRKIGQKKYLYFVPLLVTPLFINIIWSRMISVNVLSRGVGSVNKSADHIFFSILKKSFMVLESNTDAMPFMSYVIFFGLYAAGVFVLVSVLKKHKNEVKTIFTLYIVGSLLYMGVMFYAYMNVFGASDSETVAGLERYAAYYMLTGLCALVFPFFCCEREIERGIRVKAVMGAMALSCLYGTSGRFIQKVTSIEREQETSWIQRVDTKKQVEEFRKLVKDDGRIFVFGKLKTNETKMLTYEFGRQYSWDRDSYTIDGSGGGNQILINAAKYPEILTEMGYKYVWFINPNEKKREYDYLRHAFRFDSTEDGDLYEMKQVDGSCRLVYLGNISIKEEK